MLAAAASLSLAALSTPEQCGGDSQLDVCTGCGDCPRGGCACMAGTCTCVVSWQLGGR
jgi:hypothetical protein